MSPRQLLTHPVLSLPILVLTCLVAKNFYPLNNFPMYADPGPEPSEFVVVSDADNVPVDILEITGETSAKVKKKYIATRNDYATKAGIEKANQATPEICARAWQEVAERLERLAIRRKKSLPEQLRMRVGEIYQEAGAFREEYVEIGTAQLASHKP